MIDTLNRTRWLSLALTAGVLVAASSARRASAQYNGDPFSPYRAAYRSSSLPTYSRVGPPGATRRVATPPGLGTVRGIGDPGETPFPYPEFGLDSVDRFSEFDVDVLADLEDSYYEEEDPIYDRTPRRNAEVDARYYQAREYLQELYREAAEERDPRLQAEKLERYREASRRFNLGLSSTRREPGERSGGEADGRAGESEAADRRRAPTSGLPESVRSHDDLMRWSQLVNRSALRASLVEAPGN